MREILQNVAKLQGVSNMRKLGHLNNFTKVRAHMWSDGQNALHVLFQMPLRFIKQYNKIACENLQDLGEGRNKQEQANR